MKRFLLCMTLVAISLFAMSFLQAQQNDHAEEMPVLEYRVMSLYDMFKDDDAAMQKVRQISIKVTRGDGNTATVTRHDMDTKDYETAINRLANEGWDLITINKSNYWVFKRAK